MSELEDYPEPAFWEGHQPGVRFADAPVGSRDFFALVERQRYVLEPHIPGIVRWDRWRDSDVYDERLLLEIPMLVGHYHMLAFALNSAGVQREEGVPGFPA